jgi:hypothetical protein
MTAMFLAASILVFVISFSCVGAGWTPSLIAACAANVSLWLGQRVHASWIARPVRRNEQGTVSGLTARRAI